MTNMPTDCISYQQSGYFTPIINDYLNNEPSLSAFYNRTPTLENFGPQISEKIKNYSGDRKVLVDVLREQYSGIEYSASTLSNIDSLLNPNTFTITTGHQLNLFTGPLYFLYKII